MIPISPLPVLRQRPWGNELNTPILEIAAQAQTAAEVAIAAADAAEAKFSEFAVDLEDATVAAAVSSGPLTTAALVGEYATSAQGANADTAVQPAVMTAAIGGTKRIVSAALMSPRFGSPTYSSAGAVPFPHWSLDGAGATESVNVFAEIPSSWLTYTAKVVGTNETAATGAIRLALGINELNETGSIDGASQASGSVTSTALSAGVAHIITMGTALARPSSGIARLSVQRNSADAADTLVGDWAVCWIELTKVT